MGVFLGVREVGIYAVAATLVAFVPIVLQSVNQIFSPTIADLYARGDHALLGRLFQTLTKWVLGLTLPLAFVVMLYSQPLMLLFGPAFGAGWVVLIVGTLGQLINTGVGLGRLSAVDVRQSGPADTDTSHDGRFCNRGTLVLVRPFGMLGVAAAAALTNILNNYFCLREVRRALRLSPYNRTYFRLILPALAALGVTLGIKFLSAQFQPQWIWIVIALAGFLHGVLWTVLIFGLDDDDKMIVAAIRGRILRAGGK